MLLFFKLVDETQISKPPKPTCHGNSITLLTSEQIYLLHFNMRYPVTLKMGSKHQYKYNILSFIPPIHQFDLNCHQFLRLNYQHSIFLKSQDYPTILMRLLLRLKVSVDSSFTAVKSSGTARASETRKYQEAHAKTFPEN